MPLSRMKYKTCASMYVYFLLMFILTLKWVQHLSMTILAPLLSRAVPEERHLVNIIIKKASSCVIVRIHSLISWTIWQTAYAPSSSNVLHLLIKWMSRCVRVTPLTYEPRQRGLLSQTRGRGVAVVALMIWIINQSRAFIQRSLEVNSRSPDVAGAC